MLGWLILGGLLWVALAMIVGSIWAVNGVALKNSHKYRKD